ncbi:MAG: hypothetical protein JSV19_13000 [Phycisphaerales bacterium]|nr:MAG: hypothetical protein JSV19_13000 [Phycisphaerales bacterium]
MFWPSEFAGRQLAVVTGDYAVYALAPEIATDLRGDVDSELAAFRARYPGLRIGKGIVVAIEPGEEPCLPVREREMRNADRRSAAVWYEPPAVGRPYAFGREPYFRESFSLPWGETPELMSLEPGEQLPEWICFLSTDPHFAERFEYEVAKFRQRAAKAMRDFVFGSPVSVVLKQWWAGPAFFLMAEAHRPRDFAIDLELMHLQRRETLWAGWLTSGIAEPSQRERELAELRRQIGAQWARIWDRQPMD